MKHQVLLGIAVVLVIIAAFVRIPEPAYDASYVLLEASADTVYTMILAKSFTYGGFPLLRVIHLALAVATLFLVYGVGRGFGLKQFDAATLSLIVALSPLRAEQVLLFDASNFIIVVWLIATFLFLQKSWVHIAGLILLMLTSISGIPAALASCATVLFVGFQKFSRERTALYCLLSIIPVVAGGIQTKLFELSWEPIVQTTTLFITDLGAAAGIGLFEAVIGAIGLIMFWQNKRLAAIILATALVTFSVPGLLPFASIGLAEIVRRILMKLYRRKWSNVLLRNMTLTIIMCGLLFSSLAHMNTLSEAYPYTITEIDKITDSIPENSKILVLPPTQAGFIAHRAQAEAYVTGAPLPILEADRLRKELDALTSGRTLQTVTDLLDKTEISHIILLEEQPNLEFVLGNQNNFQEIRTTRTGTVWRYVWADQPQS